MFKTGKYNSFVEQNYNIFSIGVSGGHLNPAITVALATVGKLKWIKVINF